MARWLILTAAMLFLATGALAAAAPASKAPAAKSPSSSDAPAASGQPSEGGPAPGDSSGGTTGQASPGGTAPSGGQVTGGIAAPPPADFSAGKAPSVTGNTLTQPGQTTPGQTTPGQATKQPTKQPSTTPAKAPASSITSIAPPSTGPIAPAVREQAPAYTGPFIVEPATPTVVPTPGKAAAPTAASTRPALDTPLPRLPNVLPEGPSVFPRKTTLPAGAVGPAASPVTRKELQDGWQGWRKAWETADASALSDAERVQYILMNRAAQADLVPLRQAMVAEYDKASQERSADSLRLGALAHTIALASLQECMAKARVDRPAMLDETAVRDFLGRMEIYRKVREDVVAWSFRTFEHAAAVDPKDTKARAYLFDRVITLLRTVPEYATEVDDPGGWLKGFAALKPRLAALAPDGDPRKPRFELALDDFEKTMTAIMQTADDRRAVRDLIEKHRLAWNQKDQKTFTSLFLPDSRAKQILATKRMEDSIGYTEWQLETERPYTVWVAGDTASIEALTRYCDKSGTVHTYQISGLRARKTPDGWRLE
jgi:hypothetical protein